MVLQMLVKHLRYAFDTTSKADVYAVPTVAVTQDLSGLGIPVVLVLVYQQHLVLVLITNIHQIHLVLQLNLLT